MTTFGQRDLFSAARFCVMIVDKTISFLKNTTDSSWDSIVFDDVRIGPYLTAVKLSDGSAGVATTVQGPMKSCRKDQRRFGPFSPGKIKGSRVSVFFELQNDDPIMESLRMATLNALSSGWAFRGGYKIHRNTDPIDILPLNENKKIVLIGAFQSYIRKISETNNDLIVLELQENALFEDQKHLFVPAEEAKQVLPEADIVIMTGMTMVNHTFEGLLELFSEKQTIVVTGPSSNILPQVLFEHKVSIIGATMITDADRLLQLAGEAGAGYHLFHYCAEKIAVERG